jgi:hypothetical protein
MHKRPVDVLAKEFRYDPLPTEVLAMIKDRLTASA